MNGLLYALFVVCVVVLSSVSVLAQNLPGDLNQNSSVPEIVKWLDQTSFRNARIILKDSWDADSYRPPWDDSEPGKNTLLGAWRTDFRYRGWFARTIVGLNLSSPDWKEPQRWQGMNVAFTFDTKEMGEKFDAAFRNAIRLCKPK